MLLDPETLALAPGVERLLPQEGLKTELFSCLIETNTPVCETAFEARDELVRLRRLVVERAAREGLVVAAAGSHPFSIPEEQRIVDEPRYRKMVDELGAVAKAQLVCGLHVHVGMESFDACLRDARRDPALARRSAPPVGELAVPRRRGDGRALLTALQAAATASRRPAAAAGDGGGLGGGSRRGRRRLHADLVGRAPASAARDARGPRSPTRRRPSTGRPRSSRSCRRSARRRRRPGPTCSKRSSRRRASSAPGSSSRRCASRRRRCGSSRSAEPTGSRRSRPIS